MIKKMGIEHIEQVARIHVTSWAPYEISVKLGEAFLKRCFYSSVVISPVAFGYVYVDHGKVAAYATGFYKYEEFNRSALKRNIFYLAALILRRLFSGRVKPSDLLDMLRDNRKLRKLRFPQHHLGALALSNEHKESSNTQDIMIETIGSVLAELEERGCGGCWGACDERNKPMRLTLSSLGFKQVDTITYASKVTTVFETIFGPKKEAEEQVTDEGK